MSRTALVAALIFIAILATRAPFAAQTLWAHDSVLYARAIEEGFHVDDDLRDQRPHPPGYLLYVATANAVHLAGLETNDALVLVSAFASAAGAALLFLMARRRVGESTGVLIAVAYAVNPLVWHYSEVAYPYSVLALGSIVIAWCCLAARGRGLRAAVLAGIAFGIAGGFRQDLLLLLAPLWLWSVAPLGARRGTIAGTAVACASLIWLVPTIALSGGLDEYLGALRGQATYVRDAYSVVAQGWPALIANVGATAHATTWGLLLVAPLAYASGLFAARSAWRSRTLDGISFALLWTLPALAFYVLLHIGDWGYVLSSLPGLYLLAAHGWDRVVRDVGRRPAAASGWGALVVVPALLFTLGSGPFSAHAIASHDRELTARAEYVRAHFPARSTMILTREDFLLVRYYLPEYRARQHDPEPYTKSSRRMRASRAERIVVFTPGLVPDRPLDVRHVQFSKGIELVYLEVTPDAVLEFRGERYAVAAGPG